MDTLSGPCTLYAGRAPLGVIDDRLFAFLQEEDERVERWVVTPVPQHGENAVIIETGDRAAGMVLPDQKPGTQVAVTPLIAGASEPPSFPPDEVWIATPLSEADASGADPSTAIAFSLRSMSAGAGQFIGRQAVEDRSMLPKQVVLLPEGTPVMPVIAVPKPTVKRPERG